MGAHPYQWKTVHDHNLFVIGVGDQIEVHKVLPKIATVVKMKVSGESTPTFSKMCFVNRVLSLIRGWGYNCCGVG
jgi:hypothetical protein